MIGLRLVRFDLKTFRREYVWEAFTAPPHIKFSWPKMKYVHKIALKKMWSPKNQNSNIEIF